MSLLYVHHVNTVENGRYMRIRSFYKGIDGIMYMRSNISYRHCKDTNKQCVYGTPKISQ